MLSLASRMLSRSRSVSKDAYDAFVAEAQHLGLETITRSSSTVFQTCSYASSSSAVGSRSSPRFPLGRLEMAPEMRIKSDHMAGQTLAQKTMLPARTRACHSPNSNEPESNIGSNTSAFAFAFFDSVISIVAFMVPRCS